MSEFTSISEVLKTSHFVNKKKETDMTSAIKNVTDPIQAIRNILQQPTPVDLIQWKVQTVTDWGKATMVAFTDARLPRKILDEAVGIDGWEVKYERDSKMNLFCYLTIHFPNGRTITKGDCGIPSAFESEKGEASDAFKRACFSWGICADLYDLDIYQIDCVEKGVDQKTGKKKWDTWALKGWKPANGQVGIKGLTAKSELKDAVKSELKERGHEPVVEESFDHDEVTEFPDVDSDPDGSGEFENGNEWDQGRRSSIGFTKNAQDLWMNIDEALLWWIVDTMNHISDKTNEPIPVSVERKIKACKEIIMRIDSSEWIGTGWWGTPDHCPVDDQRLLRDKINTTMKDLS